jgi:hypothetical protein
VKVLSSRSLDYEKLKARSCDPIAKQAPKRKNGCNDDKEYHCPDAHLGAVGLAQAKIRIPLLAVKLREPVNHRAHNDLQFRPV